MPVGAEIKALPGKVGIQLRKIPTPVLVGAGVLAVAGFVLWQRSRSSSGPSTTADATPSGSAGGGGGAPLPSPLDVPPTEPINSELPPDKTFPGLEDPEPIRKNKRTSPGLDEDAGGSGSGGGSGGRGSGGSGQAQHTPSSPPPPLPTQWDEDSPSSRSPAPKPPAPPPPVQQTPKPGQPNYR